jgi:DNA-binding IclR family transcriptional regulator
MTAILDEQARAVLMAVKHCAKPWSMNGGGRLSEIAQKSGVGDGATSLYLHRLVKEKFIVELKSEGRYKIPRYYLRIGDPKSKQQ